VSEDAAGESRNRMIAQATRQALVQDIARARANIPAGAALVLAGIALVICVWQLGLGLVASVLGGGIGLIVIPLGLAVLGKAAGTIGTSRKKIRELDERMLPSARVVR
jgi:hypothetical protein